LKIQSSKVPFDIGPKPGKFNENVDDTAADNENGPAKPATGSTETKNSQKTLKMIGKIRTLSAEEMELENQKELELSGQDEYVEFGSDETENFKLRSGSGRTSCDPSIARWYLCRRLSIVINTAAA
jgi:hypothetical protein